MKSLLILSFLSLIIAYPSLGQAPLSAPAKINSQIALKDFFDAVEKEHPVKFFYQEEWIRFFLIDGKYNGKPIREVLDAIFADTDIRWSFMFGYAVILVKNPDSDFKRAEIISSASSRKKQVRKFRSGKPEMYFPGKVVSIKGTIKSELSEDQLAGVSIRASDINKQTATDERGAFEIKLPAGQHVLEIEQINFESYVFDLEIYKDTTVHLKLLDAPTILQEVEVSDQAIVNRRVSQSTLTMKDIKRAPTFLGELDVIKNLQAQPGVTTVGEVAAGFNVRGGGTDQNLVLYDGVPVFNTSHALGFFTAFNPDVVGQVSFYRGGIPAEYGGRVSSVLDISSREGNTDKFNASGGIGIISSHLTVGGPIKKDTTTYIASFRSTYSDWLLDVVKSKDQNINNGSIQFYDGSAKIIHRLNRSSRLIFSGYTSRDKFTLANDTLYNWVNVAASLRLDKTYNEKFFGSYALSYGSYSYKLREEDAANAFDLGFGIKYPSLKADFNLNGRHALSFGLHNTYYVFQPGQMTPGSAESTMKHIKISDEASLETALYLADGFSVSENLYVEGGIRFSIFNRFGKGVVYIYAEDKPLQKQNVVDSVEYGSGEIMKSYSGLEPRLSLRYSLSANSSVKLGYNRIYQYLHLISNSAAVAPVDIWQSSNTYFRPQKGDQISIGYYRSHRENKFEGFVEGFYKRVSNVLDFKDGAQLILNKQLETALLPGTADSYGVEFSFTKTTGRLLGTVNYTYSRSLRKSSGEFKTEEINSGNVYNSNFDQPHVVNLNWRYGISRRHFFSGNFVYHTGRPMSIPSSVYEIDGVPIADFKERNTYRLPAYHRLDIAFIIEGNHKRKKILDGNWVISFYNMYARKNAYSAFFEADSKGYLKPYQLSVIGTVIPSISYTFKI